MLEGFTGIFVINLASRADRRSEMSVQLGRVGLSFDSPQVEIFTAVRPDDAGGFPTIGTRGCFLSHLGVLREAARRKLESVLIFEDDMDFVPDFVQRWGAVEARLAEENWSVFYGGYETNGQQVELTSPITKLSPQLEVQNAHFVAFRGAAIPLLVAYLEAMLQRPGGDPLGGPMHVDGAYGWFRKAYPELETWVAYPELGHQRSSRTDIHDLPIHDRLPVVREVVALLRRTRNLVKRRLAARCEQSCCCSGKPQP